MFDIGFTELLLIGIVALVVIGPERLPAVARTAGQWVSKLQRFVRGVKTDLASELDAGDLKKLIGDQREQINELRSMVSSARQDFETNARDVVQDAKKKFDEIETSVSEQEVDAVASSKPAPASSATTDAAPAVSSSSATESTPAADTTHSPPPSNKNIDGSSPVDRTGS